jgi:hypothetical protein
MNQGLSVFDQFPNTREAADHLIEKITQELREGVRDPLKARIFFKLAETVVQAASKATEDLALEEAQKHGQKRFEIHGATVEIKELGTKWFYDNTQDPELARIQEEFAKIDKKLKDRQKFLQTLPETGMEIVDEDTGDVTRIFPAYKTSTTGLAISLKTKEVKP